MAARPKKTDYTFEDWRAAASLSTADDLGGRGGAPSPDLVDTSGRPAEPRPPVITVTDAQLKTLWGAIQPQQQLAKWSLAYGLQQHGASPATAYRRLAKLEPTLLLVRATSGEVFGAMAGRPWAPDSKRGEYEYYGKGENTWLFSFGVDGGHSERGGAAAGVRLLKQGWSRANSDFQYCGASGFVSIVRTLGPRESHFHRLCGR
eukprot:SAG22_NODE_1396_length_4509_cov_15.427211_2_plen_204_part_00